MLLAPAEAPAMGDLVAFAPLLAETAAAAILPYFRSTLHVEDKSIAAGQGQFDPVTVADRAAEQALRAAIGARFPDHAVLGEEFGASGSGPSRWIIDPIDGTRAFMMGLLSWGTLIGLAHNDHPYFGVMVQPYVQELFWNDAAGAHWHGPHGGGILRTRPCATLKDAIVACTDPTLFRQPAELAAYQEIAGQARMSRYGGDCYAYAMLASGAIDLVIEANLQSYDVAALIPIVEKAGGRMTTWAGGPALDGGRIIAAGDARVHEAALAVLSRVV